MCFLSVSKETVAKFDSLRVKCGESCHERSVWMHEVNNPSTVTFFWRANVKKFLWVVYFSLCGSSFLCYYLKNTHRRTRRPWRNLNKSSNLCLTPKLKMPECPINLYIQSVNQSLQTLMWRQYTCISFTKLQDSLAASLFMSPSKYVEKPTKHQF